MAKVLTEVFGWVGIALILISIWSPEYNSQLFATAVVSLVLMLVAHANIKPKAKPNDQ